MADADDPARRRVMRLLRAPPLALLLGLGLGPFFLLFPALPAGPEQDSGLLPVALWLGAALLGGLAGALEGAGRPLYRAGCLILAATLLSPLALRLVILTDPGIPQDLATLLGLDGESAMDAALYEIWLAAWMACLAAILPCRLLLTRYRSARRDRPAGASRSSPGA
jgi:hypothetical protein